MKNLTIKEAATKMGCCPSYARRRLREIDRENPGMGVIVRPTGKEQGHIEVNPVALALITSKNTAAALEELTDRVGMVEADMSVIRTRLGAVERKAIRYERSQLAC